MSARREPPRHELVALLLAGSAAFFPLIAAAQAQPGTVAAAAAPQAGNGESALIGATAEPAPPQQRNETAAPKAAPKLVRSTPPPVVDTAADQAPAESGTGLKLWSVAPIRWGGDIGLSLLRTQVEGQPGQTHLMQTTNFRGSSYFWKPWFAQVNGDVSLVLARSHQGASGAPGGGDMSSNRVEGGGTLALFPVSRFPFTAFFRKSDSRTSGELTTNPYTMRRYGLTQSYSPKQGGSTYRLSYNRSDIDSAVSGSDRAEALAGSVSMHRGFHTLNLNARRYTNTNSKSGDSSSIRTASASHSYRPSSTFTVDSLANVNRTQYDLASGSTPLNLDSRYRQLNTFATWRPRQDSPWRLTGGARFYGYESGTNVESRSLSVNAAATYTLSRNTTFNASGQFTQVSSNANEKVLSVQRGGVDYNSDPIKLGKYSYTWTTGANVENRTGEGNSGRGLGARIGHRLTRSVALGKDSTLRLDAGQDYSKRYDTGPYTSQTLVHSGGAIWQLTLSESASTQLSATASDTRTTGYGEQHFQLINLQGSGRWVFSRWSSLGANMTLQATRQVENSFSTSLSGNLDYEHTRAFGVSRLRYHALLNINQYRNGTRLDGNIDAPLQPVNWSFEQRLEHDIGRLQTRLSLRVADVGAAKNWIIFLRVLRTFGEI